ncbi:MAG: alpha/beta fold hydrolase [Desulfuromusa sp.]|nr:alpha/beta fold hydrolase [Desulfuromusa sp.]
MRRMFLLVLVCFLTGLLAGPAAAEKPYFYPYVNPFEATVMEVPPIYEAKLPEKVPTKVFQVHPFPERETPAVFWYNKGLNCSLVYQKKEAPLVFIIAGTGARYNSPKMIQMQKAFYQAGFHVISISSPTYGSFVINASTTMVPGELYQDAKDIYRVMQLALDKVKSKIKVTDYYLTGYSLGGIQSAYVSLLDEEEKLFNFKKVLLINPPASLYNSVSILDNLMANNIPGGIENFQEWYKKLLEGLSDTYAEMGYFDLSGDYIYKAYKRHAPREDFLAALVGLSFAISSADMMFTADVMRGGGYITPKNVKMDNSTALDSFAKVGYRTGFTDYFHEYFYPYYKDKYPALTEQGLKDQLSLKHIENYLRSTKKIGLLHNQDDVIMAPGEVDYLHGVFGTRAQIYPTGGHCGNMNHPDVVRFMVNFFDGQEG